MVRRRILQGRICATSSRWPSGRLMLMPRSNERSQRPAPTSHSNCGPVERRSVKTTISRNSYTPQAFSNGARRVNMLSVFFQYSTVPN